MERTTDSIKDQFKLPRLKTAAKNKLDTPNKELKQIPKPRGNLPIMHNNFDTSKNIYKKEANKNSEQKLCSEVQFHGNDNLPNRVDKTDESTDYNKSQTANEKVCRNDPIKDLNFNRKIPPLSDKSQKKNYPPLPTNTRAKVLNRDQSCQEKSCESKIKQSTDPSQKKISSNNVPCKTDFRKNIKEPDSNQSVDLGKKKQNDNIFSATNAHIKFENNASDILAGPGLLNKPRASMPMNSFESNFARRNTNESNLVLFSDFPNATNIHLQTSNEYKPTTGKHCECILPMPLNTSTITNYKLPTETYNPPLLCIYQELKCIYCRRNDAEYTFIECGHHCHIDCLRQHINECRICYRTLKLPSLAPKDMTLCYTCQSNQNLLKCLNCEKKYCFLCINSQPLNNCCAEIEQQLHLYSEICIGCNKIKDYNNFTRFKCKDHDIMCIACWKLSLARKQCIKGCNIDWAIVYCDCLICNKKEITRDSVYKCKCQVCESCQMKFNLDVARVNLSSQCAKCLSLL